MVSKFNVGLKTLLHQGLSEPEFYSDLVYKVVGRADFSDQFRKIIICYKRIGYNINIMRQSACLVVNPITINNFAFLFNCTPVDRASDSMMAPTKSYLFELVGTGAFLSVAWPTEVQLLVFLCSSVPVVLFDTPGIYRCRSLHVVSVESSSVSSQYLFVIYLFSVMIH